MRRNKILLLAVLALISGSCEKSFIEEPYTLPSESLVTFSADSETRTLVSEQGSVTSVAWNEDDAVDVFEFGDAALLSKSASVTTELSDSGRVADFGVKLPALSGGAAQYLYTAVYPKGAVCAGAPMQGTASVFSFAIPQTQYLRSTGNLSRRSDILVSLPYQSSSGRLSDQDKVRLTFLRPGCMFRLGLKGITSGEKILSAKLTAPQNIVGYCKVDLLTGTVSEPGFASAGRSLELRVNDMLATGDDVMWCRVLSGLWPKQSEVSIAVQTDKALYSKSITLSEDFIFSENGLTKVAFDLSQNRKDSPAAEGMLIAAWEFSAQRMEQDGYSQTFSSRDSSRNKEAGDGGCYVGANLSGDATLQYVQVDKSSVDTASKASRVVGSTGHPYVTGAWVGDYWLFTLNHDFQEGDVLSGYFKTRISATGLKYWMLEWFDGASWNPVFEQKEVTVSGAICKYNFEESAEDQDVNYMIEIPRAMTQMQVRLRAVSLMNGNGSVITAPGGGTVRIAGAAGTSPWFRVAKGAYNIYGSVKDDQGKPVSGVQVSDGHKVTYTDVAGNYTLNSQKADDASSHGYVFIEVPAGYEPQLDGVFPRFWQSIKSKDNNVKENHDFVLNRSQGNDRYTLLTLGDLHLCNRTALKDKPQFAVCLEDVESTIASAQAAGRKAYVVTLGDMTWDLYWDNSSGYSGCNFDLTAYRSYINSLSARKVPYWHTMGNHDYDYTKKGDWDTARPYKSIIGPVYYSFNIGKVHYIVLDNIVCTNDGTTEGRGNTQSVSAEQIEWVKKDMLNVPSGAPVMVFMHGEAYRLTSASAGSPSSSSINTLNAAIGSTHKIHYVTGDTHEINNYAKPSASVSEHNAGAVCADWWWTGRHAYDGALPCFSQYMGKSYFMQGRDGVPAGYTIYEVDGESWTSQFKGVGLPLSKQFKAYDRNSFAISSANYPGKGDYLKSIDSDSYKLLQFDYRSASTANQVYINVWNYDPSWTITVHDNSSDKDLTLTKLSGYVDPMTLVTYNASRYASGNACTSTFKAKTTFHMFRVTASSATSTLRITVKDGYGRTFEQTMTRPKAFDINWD